MAEPAEDCQEVAGGTGAGALVRPPVRFARAYGTAVYVNVAIRLYPVTVTDTVPDPSGQLEVR